MTRAPIDQSDRIRESARRNADSSRIWRMISRRGEGRASGTDHRLEPQESGLGICRRCGLDRINHPAPNEAAA